MSRFSSLLLLLLLACSGSSSNSSEPDANIGTDAEPGDPTPRFERSAVRIELTNHSWGIQLAGRAFDLPEIDHHEESARQGQCRLLSYVPSVCDPDCGADVCVNAQCKKEPVANPVGKLSIEGVPTVEELDPQGGNYFFSQETTPLAANQEIRVRAPGGPGPAFDLRTSVPAALEQDGSWDDAMAARGAGEDVTLRWKAPAADARFYLRMTTGIGTHGGISPVEVECEGPDTGSLTLPGSYLDDLFAEGWSCGECGQFDFFRYRESEAEVDGLDVRVRASVTSGFYFHPNL